MATSSIASEAAFTFPSWIVIGDKALARDRAALQRLKIKYIVNVTPPLTSGGVANFFSGDAAYEYHRAELRDVATENILPQLPAVVEFMQRARVRATSRPRLCASRNLVQNRTRRLFTFRAGVALLSEQHPASKQKGK